MQVERRVNLFTMPRRRRFKPRIDCVAILGKLSSYSSLYHYIYNPPQTPPFGKEGLVVARWATLPWQEWSMVSRDIIDISEFRSLGSLGKLRKLVRLVRLVNMLSA